MAPYGHFLLCSLLLLLTLTRSSAEQINVTCLVSDECVLPCRFSSDGKGARIMWYKKKAVVSCTRYGNTSWVVGHNSPADMYKGRTDLYADQVLEGNATLLLRNVTPHDEGKYICITMTAPRNDESGVIALMVKAPVEKIDMEFSDDVVYCRAERIYPKPFLTWSVEPLTEAKLFYNKTKTEETYLRFFNIESTLQLKAADTSNMTTTFICDVTSEDSSKRARLKVEAAIRSPAGSDVKVPCNLPRQDLDAFELTWRIRHSEHILSMNVSGLQSRLTLSDDWKIRVMDSRSAWRHLKLPSVELLHQGTYTCEVRTPDVTYFTQTDVIVISDDDTPWWVYFSTLTFFVSLLYFLTGYLLCKVQCMNKAKDKEQEDNTKSNHNVNMEPKADTDKDD